VNTAEAKKNLDAGVAKILKMQDVNGGWKYWENDSSVNDHITPYVIRSLYEFRKLGVSIPDDAISRGLDYMVNHIESMPATPSVTSTVSSYDADTIVEVFATLARANHPKTRAIQALIDITKLSRHGYLMYSVGLASLGELDAKIKQSLKSRMSSRDSESYWYWDDTADQAIYARLLSQIGERREAADIISGLLR
jgi:alpha-2-macroglobulin